MFARPTFGLVAVCVTIFTGFFWFSSSQLYASASRFEQKSPSQKGATQLNIPDANLKGNRAPAPATCDMYSNVEVDEPVDDPIWDVQNRTLGFQKIFAISMPHRSDKRDNQALFAFVSDLDIEFIDGVNGSEVHPKALPYVWNSEQGAGTVGCWRAHLDIYRKMIQEKIQTALILEDDADWDVLIRAQMTEVARGTRYVTNATMPVHSPYGDNWDILTVGHYGVDNKPWKEQRYWVTQNDPTVVPESRRKWVRKPDISAASLAGEHTRLVHEAWRFTATQAYAISLRGAARVLYDQTLEPNARAIDMAMGQMCKKERWGASSCIASYPMIFGRYRAAGPMDGDSDRRAETNGADPGAVFEKVGERKEALSECTVFPVSLNVDKLLAKEWVLPAQVPDKDMQKTVNLKEFLMPRGKPVVVQPDEYAQQKEQKEEKEKKQKQ